ncbi:MAG: polysaccharide biosynthesis tyrosine autokinase [Anaerolineales bacterium]|nr:polysaccharide biosynthesis tyrosine autokinase [Anaerolineales bacterium]
MAATAVAGGSSFLATRQQPTLYRSSTALMIGNPIENPNPSNNDLYLTQQLAAGYVNLANRPSVRDDAAQALGLDFLPVAPVVSQLNNTNIIEIFVTDTDPERAQAIAAEIARQLVLRSPTVQQDELNFINELLANYETAIRETRDELEQKQEELGQIVSASEYARVQSEIGDLQASLRTLETNYTSLLASTQRGALNTVRVIEAAYPGRQLDPNNMVTMITAAGIGFVLSAAAAYILDYMDDTVKNQSQVTRLTDLPTLAGIAEIKQGENTLITVKQPRSPVAEAFRVLRTGIQFTSVDDPNYVILVTSSTPAEGKSTTAANLAVVLAQAGNNVLLIDADLRRPSQQELFDLPNRRGLTNLLVEYDATREDEEVRLLLKDTVQVTRVEGLQLLTSGPVPPNPSELLGSNKMQSLLDVMQRQFDYLVLDSPPVLSVTDAAVLSTKVDGALLVVRASKTRRGHLKQSMELLQEVKANVIGCALNAISPKADAYSNYYYYKNPYYLLDEEEAKTVVEQDVGGKLRRRFSKSAISQ